MASAKTARTKGEETHERIVEHAARAIRRAGYEGVSVAEIMKAAGLTHGGFYAHFRSREALLVEALERAASETLGTLSAEVEVPPPEKRLEALVERYLSDVHVKKPEGGCSLAALGSETHRQAPEVRSIASRQTKTFLSLIERLLRETGETGEPAARRDEARVLLSALVGSLILARAVDDAELSRSLRGAVKRFAAKRRNER